MSLLCKKCAHPLTLLDEKISLYYCLSCATETVIENVETEEDENTEKRILSDPDSSVAPHPPESEELLQDFSEDYDDVEERSIIEAGEKEGRHSKRIALILTVAILASLAGLLGWNSQKAEEPETVQTEEKAKVKRIDIDGEQDYILAEATAKDFLSAQTLDEAIAKVLPDPHIIKHMSYYWRPVKEEIDLEFISILLTQKEDQEYALFIFKHKMDTREKQVVVVMDAERNFYFDWRTYEQIQDIPLEKITEGEENTVYMIRVIAKKTQYYNYGYDEGRYRSYQLYNPNRQTINDKSCFAFADFYVAAELNRARKKMSTVLLLKLEWKGEVAEIKQVVSNAPARYHLTHFSTVDSE